MYIQTTQKFKKDIKDFVSHITDNFYFMTGILGLVCAAGVESEKDYVWATHSTKIQISVFF